MRNFFIKSFIVFLLSYTTIYGSQGNFTFDLDFSILFRQALYPSTVETDCNYGIQCSNGNYLLAGTVKNLLLNNTYDAYFVKLSSNGSYIAQNIIGRTVTNPITQVTINVDDIIYCIKEIPDGGYVAVGKTYNYNSTYTDLQSDIWIVFLNENLVQVDEIIIDLAGQYRDDDARYVEIAQDMNYEYCYLITGAFKRHYVWTNSNKYILKYDDEKELVGAIKGTINWPGIPSGYDLCDDWINTIKQDENGNYAVVEYYYNSYNYHTISLSVINQELDSVLFKVSCCGNFEMFDVLAAGNNNYIQLGRNGNSPYTIGIYTPWGNSFIFEETYYALSGYAVTGIIDYYGHCIFGTNNGYIHRFYPSNAGIIKDSRYAFVGDDYENSTVGSLMNTSDGGFCISGTVLYNNKTYFALTKYSNWEDEDNYQPQFTHTIDNKNFIIKGPYELSEKNTYCISVFIESDISLSLFDITGRNVLHLLSGSFPAGNYNFSVNTENLSTGTYFIKANANGNESSIKVDFVK